jgi:hypothetical protein
MFLFTNMPSKIEPAKGTSIKDAPLANTMRSVSANSGVSFDYLMKTAQRESNLNPNAKAKTSSATGLYQFLDQTWLSTVKTQGAKFGLQAEADQIGVNKNGRLFVANPDMREKILGLRNDPAISSQLVAAFTLKNQEQLANILGRSPSEGELYLAHFLGANGAGEFIRQAANSPDSNAAKAFPDAANANHSVFYDKSGKAKTIAEVYSSLVSHFNNEPQSSDASQYQTKSDNKPLFGLFRGSDTGPVAQPIQNAWNNIGQNRFGTGGQPLSSLKPNGFFPSVHQSAPVEISKTMQPLNLLSFLRQR